MKLDRNATLHPSQQAGQTVPENGSHPRKKALGFLSWQRSFPASIPCSAIFLYCLAGQNRLPMDWIAHYGKTACKKRKRKNNWMKNGLPEIKTRLWRSRVWGFRSIPVSEETVHQVPAGIILIRTLPLFKCFF